MEKKGFTLIELLAVIVILAIIAVITVPKIADMISSSRQGGAEDSFYGTLKAAELGYAKALQSNTNLKESTCTIGDSKINCTNGVKIDVSGKTPISGTITISKTGSISGNALRLNGYKCYGDLSTSSPCIKDNEKTASEFLITKVVTSGDGLYKIGYDNRYIYRGSNPNNYIKFNNENWRIISVENDGTLKIMRNDVLENPMPYDSANRRLKSNNTFCLYSNLHGCNVWNSISGTISNENINGTVTQNSEINDYLNNEYFSSLSNSAKGQITKHIFYTGQFNQSDYSLTVEEIYEKERSLYWDGNIGLINPSEYMLSSLNTSCTTIGNSRNGSVCKDKNYMPLADEIWWWSMNGNSYLSSVYPNNNANVVGIGIAGQADSGNNGAICSNTADKDHPYARPVLYLKANTTISGSGTSSSLYTIN